MGEEFSESFLDDIGRPKEIDEKVLEGWQRYIGVDMASKPKLLFLDDRSKRLHAALRKYGGEYDVTLVCTAKECIKMLSNEGPWDVVSLDHDLDFDEFVDPSEKNTGMEVVRWLCRNKNFLNAYSSVPGMIWLHTSNNAVAYKMAVALEGAGYSHYNVERFSYDD